MSLTEIKTAVDAPPAEELTELARFIRERDNAAWDRQIDADFVEGGRRSQTGVWNEEGVETAQPRTSIWK